MIDSKAEYKRVMELEKKQYPNKWYNYLPFDMTEKQVLFRHQRLLRKAEYAVNTGKPWKKLSVMRLLRLQTRHHIHVPLNVWGEGCKMMHLGETLFNDSAKVGKYCQFQPGSMVVASNDKAPILGDRVCLSVGAKIIGGITVADDIRVGANSVMTRSCTEKGAILVGAPAKVIGNKFAEEQS